MAGSRSASRRPTNRPPNAPDASGFLAALPLLWRAGFCPPRFLWREGFCGFVRPHQRRRPRHVRGYAFEPALLDRCRRCESLESPRAGSTPAEGFYRLTGAPPLMTPAGFILTGMRKYRRRARSPMILAHSLASDFFGIEERETWFPDFESFAVWPATARLLWALRGLDRPELAGQSSLEHFAHSHDPTSRRVTLCSR